MVQEIERKELDGILTKSYELDSWFMERFMDSCGLVESGKLEYAIRLHHLYVCSIHMNHSISRTFSVYEDVKDNDLFNQMSQMQRHLCAKSMNLYARGLVFYGISEQSSADLYLIGIWENWRTERAYKANCYKEGDTFWVGKPEDFTDRKTSLGPIVLRWFRPDKLVQEFPE